MFGHGTAAPSPSGVQLPSGSFFSLVTMPEKRAHELAAEGFVVIPDSPLDLHTLPVHARTAALGGSTGDATGIPAISGIDPASSDMHDAAGEGVTIAIVDTGVDFSNPDIQHSLARDADTGHPLMLDPDGQGIVLTNSTFYAAIDGNGIVRNHTGSIPDGHDSVIYTTKDGVFLDVWRGGRGTDISVYNSLYPAAGNAPVFDGTLKGDMKIGDDNRNYIRSQSGSYRLGVIFQLGAQGPEPVPPKVQVVPVLVVDSAEPGVYDTIIPDMSTSWLDYTREPEAVTDFDFDFTDEDPIVLGSGSEFFVYDSDGDGMADYTAGTAGARVLDVFAVMNATLASHRDDRLGAMNGTLLPGMDTNGRFFGVMADHVGHGTKSSATITSAGKMQYDIYNDTGSYTIRGVAPGAKILPVRALWLGDAVYGWLWAAGFENRNSSWTLSGAPRADIISNSWGISTFPNIGAAPGYDALSLVINMLSTPRSLDDDYPGTVMVSSAGNSGHGYGTLSTPGAASLGISAGASTNNVFVGYGPFKDQPRFGSSTAHHGHVVDFSGRGPGTIGDVKPDLVGIGAHGFVPGSVMGATQDAAVGDPFMLFGGTSMAGPIVAGAAAIIMSEMTENLVDYDPFVVRNILTSTAGDMYNDPFVQGAGLVDVGTALDFVHGENGVFIVHNDGSYRNLREALQPAAASVNTTGTGIGSFGLPDRDMPMTSWFAGRLQPGDRTTVTFTVENPGPDAAHVTVSPTRMSLVQHTEYSGTTVPHQQDPILNETGAFAPNYVRLADVRSDGMLADLFDDRMPFPDGASLLVLSVNFEFQDFMNTTMHNTYADDIGIASLYLYDWVDSDGNLEVTSDELSMVTRGGSWGTVQELRVSDPASRFEGVPMVGIYPVPERYSYWTGPIGSNATAIDYDISASYYARDGWDAVWTEADTLVVPPEDAARVDVTLVVPGNIDPGIHQGFVTFEGADHTVLAPVSFVVELPINGADSEAVFGRPSAAATAESDGYDATPSGGEAVAPGVLYANDYVRGSFDMLNRYMAGDWRYYHFGVNNASIAAASVDLSWQSGRTSLSAFAIDPAGRIIATNVPSGVFGHFMGWPSVDWLGSTPFSEGGGFYPISGDPGKGTSTFMTIPINGTGTYTVMVHATLFGGESTTEPVGVSIQFYENGSGVDSGGFQSNVADADAAAAAAGMPMPSAAPLDGIAAGIAGGPAVGGYMQPRDAMGGGMDGATTREMGGGEGGGGALTLQQSVRLQPDFVDPVTAAAVGPVHGDAAGGVSAAGMGGSVTFPGGTQAEYGMPARQDVTTPASNSMFGAGVLVGIAIGAAAGVAVIIMLKRPAESAATVESRQLA